MMSANFKYFFCRIEYRCLRINTQVKNLQLQYYLYTVNSLYSIVCIRHIEALIKIQHSCIFFQVNLFPHWTFQVGRLGSRSFWSRGHMQWSCSRPGFLALSVSSASPRNRRFAPLGFYCIPTYCLVSVYRPVRAVDQFDRWLNSFWHHIFQPPIQRNSCCHIFAILIWFFRDQFFFL